MSADAYRVTTTVFAAGQETKVSFIVRSGVGWKWAVEQAHMQLADQVVTGPVSVDQVLPGEPEDSEPVSFRTDGTELATTEGER